MTVMFVSLRFHFFVLLACLLTLFALFNFPVNAETFIVLDTDGSIEDYAALTALSRLNTATARAVRIISVHNTGWSFASGASSMVNRFRSLTSLPNAKVTIGALQTSDEKKAVSSTTSSGLSSAASSCVSSQGFPSTPFDAAQRNMTISRSEVTAAFTTGDKALLSTLPSRSSVSFSDTTTYAELTALVSSCDLNQDKIVYIQLGTASTLAEIAEEWELLTPSVLQRFLSITELHILDKGHAGGVDKSGMRTILSDLAPRFAKYPVHVYLPSFFNSNLRFSSEEWSTFERSAGSSSSIAVAWVFSAWEAKRRLFLSHGQTGESDFYEQSYPASTLVALCAIHTSYHDTLCPAYAGSAEKLTLQESESSEYPHESPDTFTLHEKISGDNVTYPYSYFSPFYSLPSGNADSANSDSSNNSNTTTTEKLHFRMYSSSITPPDTIPSGTTIRNSLSTSFWVTWYLLL